MNNVIETTSLISETMDLLIDFIVTDEFLGKQFEKFLEKNQIQIQKESELNDILIDYLLGGKTETGKFVLDYFEEKNPLCNKNVLYALKKSFISVFQIKRVSKNSYETVDLSSNKDFTLIPLVKTTSLRGIGLYDFIKARVIELENNFYMLEIHDTYGQLKEYEANLETVKAIIKNPKISVLYSKENLAELKKEINSFSSSFIEAFKKDEIVVSNKEADRILDEFYNFHTGKSEKVNFVELDGNFDYKFFKIKEYEGNILKNAALGFSQGEETYDAGFYFDSEFGLFIIPFLGTFNKILSLKNPDKIEGGADCVKEFLLSEKVSPNLLIKKAKEFPDIISVINKISGNEFQTIDEIIDFYKYDYKDGLKFSPINVLYASSIFSKVLGHKEIEENKTIGRNDLCPCGSGIKYKKCCLKKTGV